MLESFLNRKKLRWQCNIYLRHLYYPIKFRKPFSILGRFACLGNDVIKLLKPRHSVINVQKGRVDYLMACWEDHNLIAQTSKVIAHMKREEIIPCIKWW